MATKHKDPATAGNKEIKRGTSPIGSGSTHRVRPRPPSPSGTSVVKDHAKTHVPNYLKPTISSKTDVGKSTVGKKQHSHDDMHKPNTTSVRRRSFDKPVPASQVHKAIHQSSSSVRVAAPVSVKNSVPVVAKANNVSSLERVSKVVKAVKSQPPLVKTKSLPKGVVGSSRKEVAKTTKKASEQSSNNVKSDVVEDESLDVNVKEELAGLESPGGPHDLQPPHVIDDENHSPLAETQCDEHDHHDEQEHEAEGEAEAETENVSDDDEATQEVQESQNVDEISQQSNGAIEDEASTENDTKKEEEEEIMKAHAEVGLTVKTAPDEVAEAEEQAGQQGEEETQSAKSEPATSVVHKRQIGGPVHKKESPVYNDVIEETASKLVEKRVNKVRALAGAFETVISLEQPHSS